MSAVKALVALGITVGVTAVWCLAWWLVSVVASRRPTNASRSAKLADLFDIGDFAEPQRYVTRPAIAWWEHPATRAEWIRLEHEFGWRNDDSGTDSVPVTQVMCEPGVVYAWTSDVPDDGRALWGRTAYALLLDGTRATKRVPEPDPLAAADGDARKADALMDGITVAGDRLASWDDDSAVFPADGGVRLGIWPPVEPVRGQCRKVIRYHLDAPVSHSCEACGESWPCARTQVPVRRARHAGEVR